MMLRTIRRLGLAWLLAAGLTACGGAPAPAGDTAASGTPGPLASAGSDFAAPPPPAYPPPTPAAYPATSPAAPAPTAAQGPWQRLPVVDQGGFEQPMPALWVEVPTGWQGAGGVVWNPQAPCGATPSFQWRAQSPDGRHTLELLPAEAWTWDNLGMDLPGGRCPRWPITNVRDYLQSWVQRHRPGARVLDYRERNDLVKSAPPPSDGQTRYWKEGGELLIAYASEAGELRESVAAVVIFNETTMAGVMPGEVRKFLGGLAGSPVSARAPAGELDMQRLTHFAQSAQTDPQWQSRMNRHNETIARQGLEGQRQRGAVAAQTQRDVADMQMRGWEERNASSDRLHARTIDAITETNRYQDAGAGGQVRLDAQYDNAWRTSDGTYLRSNDPNLDPNRDLDVNAERLERIE